MVDRSRILRPPHLRVREAAGMPPEGQARTILERLKEGKKGGAAAWHPTDLASCLFFFDAANGPRDTGGSPPTDGEVVQDWLDISGNGHDMAMMGSCVYRATGGPGGIPSVEVPLASGQALEPVP